MASDLGSARDAPHVPCPHHPARGGACTGCPWMHLDDDARIARHLDELRDLYGLHVDAFVRARDRLAYRYSAKRVVGGPAGALVFGSYVAGTHTLADMADCVVDHPRLVAALSWLCAVCDAAGTSSYDEAARRGALRFVWAKTNGQQTLLGVVVASSEAAEIATLRRELVARLDGLHARGEALPVDGLALAEQPGVGNTMQGERVERVWGIPDIAVPMLGEDGATLVLDDAAPRVGPLGFLQPNPVVAGLAHRELVTVTAGLRLAFDLYAGSGATTRALRRAVVEVQPCERHPESARHLGVPPSTTEAFLEHALHAAPRPELVVANPPRAGMGAAVCERLRRLAAPELRVMSCSPRSFVRDLAWLGAEGPSGHYELVRLRAFDTLPHTTHVELVGVLRWRPPAKLGLRDE